jgi:hypothetical protein
MRAMVMNETTWIKDYEVVDVVKVFDPVTGPN